MNRLDFLLEIGTEEIPAGYIEPALRQIEERGAEFLTNARLDFRAIKTYATPRRLALYVESLAERQPDEEIEVTGPPARVALNDKGEFTSAACGFAQKQGVSVDELRITKTPKGEYLSALKVSKGKETRLVLAELLPHFITSLSFPKSMRWGGGSLRFSRPIRWILALLGQEVVEFDLDGIKSDRITLGHRFLSPGPLRLNSPSDYLEQLKESHVLSDPHQRRQAIIAGLEAAGQAEGGQVLKDEPLLDIVTYLVEYPTIILGRFKKEYLRLPREVLIASMREHQRYFAVTKGENLLPFFLVVANSHPQAEAHVRQGNERVLAARLADADFFFTEDQRKSLAQLVEEERRVIYQEELGSLYDKTERMVALAASAASQIDSDLIPLVKRAAYLAKADLLTEMVGEFPTLQGIMGYHYALLQGEDSRVATAIKEHYQPRFADDSPPATIPGMLVALADKLDIITGCFSLGLMPTGSVDPYGLRRHGLGIVRTLIERNISLDLAPLVEDSVRLLKRDTPRELADQVLNFLAQRMRPLLAERGIAQDEIEAILAIPFNDPLDTLDRALALKEIRGSSADFEPLSVCFKRARNILKSVPPIKEGVREEELAEEIERTLYRRFIEIRDKVGQAGDRREYREAFSYLAGLRSPVDDFFDHILVMCEDEALRKNRLALLSEITNLFMRLADFSRLQVKD
ncbi:MAG: glycine--tRNA ligase subunit beta [bacterium]